MEKLRDIKGLVEVSDYSLYYFIALIVLAILIILVIIYLFTRPKRRKKPTSKKIALENLKNIDYANSKDIAYNFTLNIPYFIDEDYKSHITNILEKLEKYKYKKDTLDMDEELSKEIKNLIKELRC